MWGKSVGLRNVNLTCLFSAKRMKVQHKRITGGLWVLGRAMKGVGFPLPLPSQPAHPPQPEESALPVSPPVPALGKKRKLNSY